MLELLDFIIIKYLYQIIIWLKIVSLAAWITVIHAFDTIYHIVQYLYSTIIIVQDFNIKVH